MEPPIITFTGKICFRRFASEFYFGPIISMRRPAAEQQRPFLCTDICWNIRMRVKARGKSRGAMRLCWACIPVEAGRKIRHEESLEQGLTQHPGSGSVGPSSQATLPLALDHNILNFGTEEWRLLCDEIDRISLTESLSGF